MRNSNHIGSQARIIFRDNGLLGKARHRNMFLPYHRYLKFFFLVIVLFPAITFATDFTSPSFIVRDPVLFPSGYATSSSYVLTSTIAQIAIGTSTAPLGGPREDRSGFLYFPFANSPILSATPGDSEVTLSWTASVGILGWTVSGYDVGQSLAPGGPYTFTNVGLTFSTTTTGLINGTTYYFVVRARDMFGNPIASSSQVSVTPFAVGSGSGGGTPYPLDLGTHEVVYSGKAYPGATVEVLRNGIILQHIPTNVSGDFSGSLTLSPGTYQLGFAAKDTLGRRSSLLGRQVTVGDAATTTLAGLFLSPTIALDSRDLLRDGSIQVSGQAYPGSLVSITLSTDPMLSANVYVAQVHTAQDGTYTHRFFTDNYPIGRYIVRTRAFWEGEASALSEPEYVVLTEGKKELPKRECRKGDLNDDGSIDLVDFSIATYWYKRTLKSPFSEQEATCLNNDGKVDLYDFSLMAYYWTG